jgi:hypothetical protein
MKSKLTIAIATAAILLAIVAVTVVPALVAIAYYTPVALPLLFQGATTVAVISILIGVSLG